MVAIITEASDAETRCNPKFSPKKYKNGLKRADNKKNLISFLLIFSSVCETNRYKKRNTTEIINLKKMVVRGV